MNDHRHLGRSRYDLYNQTGMDFKVKRLYPEQKSIRCYHLFSSDGALRLVADHGSPWLSSEHGRYVRLARPSGDSVASLDLPRTTVTGQAHRQRTTYAIVLDHAVYAIISQYGPVQAEEDIPARPYFVVEVEGMSWLATAPQGNSPTFVLHDEVPSNPAFYDDAVKPTSSDSIGMVDRIVGEYDFVVTLPAERLSQAAVIALSLAFLIDGAETALNTPLSR